MATAPKDRKLLPAPHHITVHVPPLLWVLITTIILLLLTIVFLLVMKLSPGKNLTVDTMKKVVPTQRTNEFTPTIAPAVQTSNLQSVEGIGLVGVEITHPVAYSTITSPVTVIGRANVFEGHVNLRVKDSSGNLLGEGFGTGCMGSTPCPFETEVSFSTSSTNTGFVESYEVSMQDGSESNIIQIPVKFQ